MNCQQAKVFIPAYTDGELEVTAMLEIERHLQSCSSCAGALRNLQGLKKSLTNDPLYFKAPAELLQKIKSELPSSRPAAPRSLGWSWNWLTTAISGAFAVCLALLLVAQNHSSEQMLAQEVVSAHVRSLMASHVLDVNSTDQHTVKPWFNGKLDFSPPVKDLAAQEFPLIGGRLDYLGGRSVAALIFGRHKHVINLFIWPAKRVDSKPVPFTSSQGYNLIRWSDAGMIFWAVSDLNQKELLEFAQDYAVGKAANP